MQLPPLNTARARTFQDLMEQTGLSQEALLRVIFDSGVHDLLCHLDEGTTIRIRKKPDGKIEIRKAVMPKAPQTSPRE